MLPHVTPLFFYLSGEHPTLTHAEVEAILQSEGILYKNVEASPQILSLETNLKCLYSVIQRSSFTKVCGIEIFRSKVEVADILQCTKELNFCDYINSGESFSIRIKKIDKKSDISINQLERTIGKLILEQTEGINVNLSSPNKFFLGLITEDHFIFGQKFDEISPKGFNLRRPSKRPFFHPSALSPKLARCMVNLARAKPGSELLDPFCGTGSILIEAGLIGCRILGLDINSKMVRGSLRNLEYFQIPQISLLTADARKLPLSKVDCVSTDPPYSLSSSTHGLSVEELVLDFLSNTIDLLPKGGCVSIALPTKFKVMDIGESVGYICVENHLVREHKSLTREIVVLKNP